MKTLAALLLVSFLMARPSLAGEVPAWDETPGPEPNSAMEGFAIGFATMASLVNVVMIADEAPHYFAGFSGVTLGLAAVLMAIDEEAQYPVGLTASGVAAMASGLIAVRYRHVLNVRGGARIEPSWRPASGATGLALVVDF